MPGGGTLTLETIVEAEHIRINITDTGEGMTAEIMQNIFVPFFYNKGRWNRCRIGGVSENCG